MLELGKHQASSLVATLVDFGVMVAVVQLLRLSPVVGTVFGAASGAVASFLLGRHWTFAAQAGSVHGQAARYAAVSAVSLAWNALGEHLVHRVLGVQYVVARAIVALVVSVAWNFPLQRWFVFHRAQTS